VIKIKQLKSYEVKDKCETEIDIQIKSENFRKIRALEKFYNIVIYTRNSPGHINDFLILAKRRILMNNRTRWNS